MARYMKMAYTAPVPGSTEKENIIMRNI